MLTSSSKVRARLYYFKRSYPKILSSQPEAEDEGGTSGGARPGLLHLHGPIRVKVAFWIISSVARISDAQVAIAATHAGDRSDRNGTHRCICVDSMMGPLRGQSGRDAENENSNKDAFRSLSTPLKKFYAGDFHQLALMGHETQVHRDAANIDLNHRFRRM